MGSGASTIVPANRLGQLLVEARHRQGADLEALSARSEFTVGELSDFEAGHRVLNDRLVEQVTSLYSIDCGPIIPQRAELTIDLNDNVLVAAGHALPLESAEHDHVLERYLSLVYVLRDREPGASVPLRAEDIAILSASLAERYELVEEQLLTAMDPERQSVRGLVGWFKQRIWVPGAGAIVGAVSIGTLVMVSGEPTAAEPASDVPEPEPEPDRGRSAEQLRQAAARFSAGIGLGASTPDPPAPATSSSTTSSTVDTSGDAIAAQVDATPTTTASTTPATSAAPNTSAPIAQAPVENPPSTATSSTATPSTATPTTTTSTVAAVTPVEVGRQAEALLPFSWRELLPGWRIVYLDENDSYRGLTYPYDKTIEMFVRDSDTAQSLAGILAHEIGHAFDVEYLDDADRQRWRDARGIGDAQWWPDAYARDFQSGAGDFAESFAFWAVGDRSSSELAGPPTGAQLAVIESFLANR